MEISMLSEGEIPPWNLLLLADPSEDLVSDYFKKGLCYVAVSDSGDTVGVIVLLEITSDKMEIMNIAVDESQQGNGIGKMLLKYGIRAAKEKGYRTLEIGTGNSSISQLALYQKAGFRITCIDHDFFVRNYDEPIFENGIQCRDMIRLSMKLKE